MVDEVEVVARAHAFAGALVADLERDQTAVTEPDPYDVEILNDTATPERTLTPAPLPALPLPPDAQAFADRLRLVLDEVFEMPPSFANLAISETRFLMGKPLPPRSRR